MTRGMIIAAALVLVTGARADPLPQPRPTGPGGSCLLWLVLRAEPRCPRRGAEGAEWPVPVGLDEQRQLLPSQRSLTSAGPIEAT
jgi:hypothetical protein